MTILQIKLISYDSVTDMQGLERHLEHVRRQHAESRDPVVGQLQSMVAAFEGREEAYKPLCAQLQQVSETMRSSAQQIQASNSRLETSVQEAMKRSVVMVIWSGICVC